MDNKPIIYNDPQYQPTKNSDGLYDYVVHDENNIHGFFGKYFFLSNGYKHPIFDLDFNNIIYPYSENAYQASKFLDINIRKLFTSIHFVDAIKLAYDFKANIKPNWDSIKLEVMELIITQKFTDPSLLIKLVNTGNSDLREDNHWQDYYWGFCNGNGLNHLGRIEMKLRDTLRE
jgi:predicted NAD-dependent protein-ADP-ribosyltransferase YbiA (DUF1768 family)